MCLERNGTNNITAREFRDYFISCYMKEVALWGILHVISWTETASTIHYHSICYLTKRIVEYHVKTKAIILKHLVLSKGKEGRHDKRFGVYELKVEGSK